MNGRADLVSVIVTSYNHAPYLGQRMQTLLNQTYPHLEIIVVDDCSTDNSRDVLAGYKDKPRVQIVILEKNHGLAHAANLGVGLSRGQLIMFAECDDYNDPSHIELLHQAMAANGQIGVAFCRSFMVDAQGRVFDEDFNHRDRAFKEFCRKDTLIPKYLAQRFILSSCIIPNMSAALIRREYFDLAGGFSPHYKISADWDFWCRISRCCDFYYLASPLNNFRRHETSHVSLSGLPLIMMEIMELLYTALRKADLTFWERFQFRVNFGVIWGRYRKPAPGLWWRSFPSIWRQSLKYDKLSLLYLMLAFMKRTTQRMMGMA